MDWTHHSFTKDEYYHSLSMLSIKNDCETIKALQFTLNQPIIILSMLPYLSLFCKALEEYMIERDAISSLSNNSSYSMSNIRSKLKLFNQRYSRSLRYVEEVNNVQDQIFKNKLRFRLLELLNCYYNMGIFFDAEGNIIGNTQLLFSFFQEKTPKTKNPTKEELKQFGVELGTIINSTCEGLASFAPDCRPLITNIQFDLYFKDINTNKHPLFSEELNIEKSESLVLFHTLTSVNFLRSIIRRIVDKQNPWRLRLEYISMYYTYKQIVTINENTHNAKLREELSQCLSQLDSTLINTTFRSCMMHYSFINNGHYCISDEFIDFQLPFGGLVESCFSGMNYGNLLEAVEAFMDRLAYHLLLICNINSHKIKPLN